MNVLITGASRGIGFEAAKALCGMGHTVLAVSRDLEGLRRLELDVQSADHRAQLHALPFSITDEDLEKELLPRVRHLAPELHVLVNNAGALLNKPFADITAGELELVYKVNVFAPFRLAQAVLPLMGGRAGAHIVNIGSMGGVQGSAKFPGLSAYSSSKAALANLSELLAEELKDRKIAVNCLALGAAQTEMLKEAFPGYEAPLTAEEMGSFVAWFAANGQRYFNGKILPVALSTP